MPRFLRPRVFLSYSRSDEELARRLGAELASNGFEVFRDTESIEPGENFVRKLAGEIRRARSVVALVTPAYAQSRWGLAELYHAHALGKPIIPVRPSGTGPATLDEPLDRFLEDVQWVNDWSSADDPSATSLGGRLKVARVRHLTTLVSRGLVGLLLVAGIVALAGWTVSNVNSLQASGQRQAVLSELEQSTVVIPSTRIQQLATTLDGDIEAVGALTALAVDDARDSAARLNAISLLGRLRAEQVGSRWFISDLTLDGSDIGNFHLTNVTFNGGNWTGVLLHDAAISRGAWLGDPPVRMSSTRFEDVELFEPSFFGFVAVDVQFVNVKIWGGEIDITNFSQVVFGAPPDSSSRIVTPDITLLEGTLITSGHDPPEPGVLDLSEAEDYTVFNNVLFVRCRMEGWFDPAWFRDSTFEDCEFPPSLTAELLEAGGNIVIQ